MSDKLTPALVEKMVGAIDISDPESAHGDEDTVWSTVLAAIANGAEDPRGLARAALATVNLEFPRWCA